MLKKLGVELEYLKIGKIFKEFSPILSRKGVTAHFRGRKLIDFSNWDLFRISENKTVLKAVHEDLEIFGMGAQSPRLSSGTLPQHLAFEKRLASFLGTEAAVIFNSRNQAVLSLVTALADERSIIFVDELLQSPVADAAYLVNTTVTPFHQADLSTLESDLIKFKDFPQKYVFCEGVSPISGKAPELKFLLDLCSRFDATVIIDESFSLGVLGVRGAGLCESLPLGLRPYCRFGSLSFGFSGLGAFVAGDRLLIDFLVNHSKTFVSEGAFPSSLLVAYEAALNIIELNVVGREKILALGLRLKRGLEKAKLISNDEFAFPLICIPFLKRRIASEFQEALFERGFLCEVALKGATLDEGAVLRILINIQHKESDIDTLLESLSDLKQRIQ